MTRILAALLLLPLPAAAATGPFLSLHNTDFVVLVAFLLFLVVLLKFKVPGLLGGMLDKRADTIRADLDAARALHDEAKALLAGYERKHKEVQEQAALIVETARREALAAADQAKADLESSIARRLRAAEDQIASAETSAVREVRDRAISVAVAAAGELIAGGMSAAERGKLIDQAIADVEKRLH